MKKLLISAIALYSIALTALAKIPSVDVTLHIGHPPTTTTSLEHSPQQTPSSVMRILQQPYPVKAPTPLLENQLVVKAQNAKGDTIFTTSVPDPGFICSSSDLT